MCLRDSPPPFSPGVIGMNTLVAITTSSRLSSFPTRRPVATSLAPPGYVLAGSKNVMPPSTAALTIGSAAVSSRTHGRSLSFPKLIMPRHTLDTLRPVRPRFVYLIATSSPSRTRRPYRRGAAPERRRAVDERFGWLEIHGGSREPGAVGPPCRVVERAVCTRQTR